MASDCRPTTICRRVTADTKSAILVSSFSRVLIGCLGCEEWWTKTAGDGLGVVDVVVVEVVVDVVVVVEVVVDVVVVVEVVVDVVVVEVVVDVVVDGVVVDVIVVVMS